MYEPWTISKLEGLQRLKMMDDGVPYDTFDENDLIRALVTYHIVRCPTNIRNLVFNMPASAITLSELLTKALDNPRIIFVAECPDQSIPNSFKEVRNFVD